MITDDKISNLLRLFEVRSYAITCGELLSDQQLQLISQKFPQHKYIPDPHQTILEVDLARSEDIYELFDILKMEHTLVESIDKGTINFEQVFMKIVKGDNGHALDQSS